MSRKDDGGPAFPVGRNTMRDGMTARDYFAAKALAAIIASDNALVSAEAVAKTKGLNGLNVVAATAYGFADAMLAERAKTEEQP